MLQVPGSGFPVPGSLVRVSWFGFTLEGSGAALSGSRSER